LREQLAKLEEQARFALAKERPDLAEAAIARQLVLEAEVEQLSVAQKLALDEAEEIEPCLTALRLRKDEMVKELAAFESSRRALSPLSAAPGPAGRAGLRAAQAETLFERVRAANVGFSPRPIEGDQAAKLAEVDRLQREATVAKRLDALLKAPASKVTGKRRKVS
jgi:phage shock protein A